MSDHPPKFEVDEKPASIGRIVQEVIDWSLAYRAAELRHGARKMRGEIPHDEPDPDSVLDAQRYWRIAVDRLRKAAYRE